MRATIQDSTQHEKPTVDLYVGHNIFIRRIMTGSAVMGPPKHDGSRCLKAHASEWIPRTRCTAPVPLVPLLLLLGFVCVSDKNPASFSLTYVTLRPIHASWLMRLPITKWIVIKMRRAAFVMCKYYCPFSVRAKFHVFALVDNSSFSSYL